MMNKVLFIIYYFKIANTGHHSCMFSVVYNNIQKITNISIKKPIILISILNKYLDIPIYLDNCTPLVDTTPHKYKLSISCNTPDTACMDGF